MKGKINKSGNLEIERAGKMRAQYCPYVSEKAIYITCGDWCPAFEEPIWCEDIEIHICVTTLEFDEFADERGQP